MAEDRTRQTTAKPHTTRPNIPDRDMRLDLVGPAAFGSGLSRSKECDADPPGACLGTRPEREPLSLPERGEYEPILGGAG